MMAPERFAAPPLEGAPESESWFVCPQCSTPLLQTEDRLRCPDCGEMTAIISGIPHFVKEFPYWGEMPLKDMLDVNRCAEMGSWRTALLQSSEPAVQNASGMILNLNRSNWHWLLDLPADSRVLDVGAGTGTNSHALALHYREVVALEPVLERIQFMRHRFAQEQISNVKIVRSSLWTLPFPPGSFDLIVMNGVLEWVAEAQEGDPGELQRRALDNMFRLLRPGGVLYIGIENRLCPEFLAGYLDPHCRMPYVTILPRSLAHWIARLKGRPNGYRNYLYSSRGYRKLLERAGFATVDCYIALPSYNHPRMLIPMINNVFAYYSRNFNPIRSSLLRRLIYNCLLKTGLLKYLQDSFAIVARKRGS